MNKEQMDELREAAKPLQAFLEKHGHPMMQVTVDSSGVNCTTTEAFIPVPLFET